MGDGDSEAEARADLRSAEAQVGHRMIALEVVGEMAIDEREVAPTVLIADTAERLPCEARAAGTDVGVIRNEPVAAERRASAHAYDAVDEILVAFRVSRARDRTRLIAEI